MPLLTSKLRKQRSNLYAVAAVISTGLQMPQVWEDLFEPQFGYYTGLDFRNPSNSNVILSGTVPLESLTSPSVKTTLALNDESFDEDFVVRPKYVKEVLIKVGSFKISKSIPKIYID